MTENSRNYGRIPTDPITLITGLCLLYCLISLLTPDQRDTLGIIAGIAVPYLPGRR